MSSVRRRERRRWTLRARLLAQLVVLLAVVCLVIGVAAGLALRNSLLTKLDDQLRAADHRTAQSGGPQRGPGPSNCGGSSAQDLFPPGQQAGTIGARIADGQVQAGLLADSGCGQPLSSQVAQQLSQIPTDHEQHTVALAGRGDYRLIATLSDDGTVQVTGLPLADMEDTLTNLVIVMSIVAVVGLAATALVGALIIRITLRPLHRVAATASRVAELPLDRGEVALSVRVPDADTDTHTEVGQVGSALNRMLGHIAAALAVRHASETRVRQFVADASHELRTPLASIRGYAELADRYRDSVPPDVSHAMSRVQSESVRMTTLVEDLLLLARLDSGRPPAREPVDLSRLVVDAVSDAHIASPAHHWRLEVPAEPVTVSGDVAALHQVVANLLSNASVHTPAGSTVTTSIRPAGQFTEVVVADDGPGIPADLQPEVFERFARGDGSRSRSAGSTGLGLAIVAAIVGSHGGTVDLSSRPGRTAFTVRLPAGP